MIDLIDPAAEIAGQHAQRRADAAGDDGAHHADDQRHACAEDQPAQDIAALEIGAEQRMRAAALPTQNGGSKIFAPGIGSVGS